MQLMEDWKLNLLPLLLSDPGVLLLRLGWQIADNLQVDLLSFVGNLTIDNLEGWIKNHNFSVVLKF
jgi:hypothetical protein